MRDLTYFHLSFIWQSPGLQLTRVWASRIKPSPREFGLSYAGQPNCLGAPLDFRATSRCSDGPEATFPANVPHLSRTLAASHVIKFDYAVVAYSYQLPTANPFPNMP